MKALVWWLRSAFCRHEWEDTGTTLVHLHRSWDDPDTKLLDHTLKVKECRKCGWIWRQRL